MTETRQFRVTSRDGELEDAMCDCELRTWMVKDRYTVRNHEQGSTFINLRNDGGG